MTHAYTAKREAGLLGALATAVTDRVDRAVSRATGLSGSAPGALVTLDSPAGGTTLEALCTALSLSHSGAVRLADRLVAAGLVERRRGRDRRSRELALTPAGRRAVRQVREAREAECETLLSLLTEGQRQLLTAVHASVLAALDERGPGVGWVCRLCDRHSCRHGPGGCPVETGSLRRRAHQA